MSQANRSNKQNTSLIADARSVIARYTPSDNRAIMSEIRMIGGALIMILIVVLVLGEVSAPAAINSGPFAGVEDTANTTGAAALSLLVVGTLVVAAVAIMRFFNRGGWGR